MDEFLECLERRKLYMRRMPETAVKKEISEAEKDLASAVKSLGEEDWKWAIVQSYYSMFHSARALVFRKGYREKGHWCLLVALRKLYVEGNLLEARHADSLENAMLAREDADYGAVYPPEGAKAAVDDARRFLGAARKQLEQKPINRGMG